MKSNLRSAVHLVLVTGAMSTSMLAIQAHAQEAKASANATIEEVTVTGSRIKRANLTSSSPVVQVNADEFLYQGVTRVEDMMNDLPQVFAGQTAGQANGASGTATVDLRGLGSNRTLTLLNGRRLPAGDPVTASSAADLNQIPGALVERVEVLTGGASATYGSDAVAGVVNFILKDNFEGVQVDYQYGFYQHNNSNSVADAVTAAGFELPSSNVSDGESNDVSLIMGVNTDDGRGNVTMYATKRHINAVLEGERDYSACALNGGPGAWGCGGSSTLPEGRFTDFGTVTPGFDFIVQGDQFVPRNGTLYNYAPLNYFQRPDERNTFGAYGHYDINDHVEVYAETSFMDDHTVAQIAPSGAFFVTNSLNCSNPFMSAQQFQALCGDYGLTTADSQSVYIGRRNVEGGARASDIRHTSFRTVVGARGDINDTWSYDAYVNVGQVNYVNVYQNDMSTTHIIRALNAVPDPVTGDPVCQSVVDGSDPSCVPWNIFTTGAVTQDMIDYLILPLYAKGEVNQKQINGYVTGDLGDYGWTLPGASEGVKVAFGTEYRKEESKYEPDSGYTNGDGAGQGGAQQYTAGQFDVKEIFTEAHIPVLQGKDFAQELNIDVGYRYSDYSTNQTTDTYKLAADWVVNDQVRFRGSYQKAVRAANIGELFAPQTYNLFDMTTDPCGTATPVATLAQCANSGVTAAQYGLIPNSPAGQYNYIQGGNPDLIPEDSDTYSAGFQVTPSFAPGLLLSIDWWQIEVKDAITTVDPGFILDQCVYEGTQQFCDLVHRSSANGNLWIGSANVTSTSINISTFKTDGVDIQADYTMSVGDYGDLNLSYVATWLSKWEQTTIPGATPIECAGNWGGSCGQPSPELRGNFRATWITPWDLTVSGSWRYSSSTTDLDGNIDIGAISYLDLAVLYDVMDGVTARVGINNLLDKDPPVLTSSAAGPSVFGNGNTFPGVYDALGRYVFAGLSVKF